ncbi:hypothetical protein B0H11DRAFT_1907590 [Mycena galericulata]|nr:hypothetical protein B0H11DRAFT_1907590 [Mycena galericulata]
MSSSSSSLANALNERLLTRGPSSEAFRCENVSSLILKTGSSCCDSDPIFLPPTREILSNLRDTSAGASPQRQAALQSFFTTTSVANGPLLCGQCRRQNRKRPQGSVPKPSRLTYVGDPFADIYEHVQDLEAVKLDHPYSAANPALTYVDNPSVDIREHVQDLDSGAVKLYHPYSVVNSAATYVEDPSMDIHEHSQAHEAVYTVWPPAMLWDFDGITVLSQFRRSAKISGLDDWINLV